MAAIPAKRLGSIALGLALTLQVSAPVVAAPADDAPPVRGCKITQDDGDDRFIDLSVNGCEDYYPAAHLCGGAHRTIASSSFCGLQDRIKAVDPNGVDMIINAHRGVWGLSLNDPRAATNANYDIDKVTVGGPAENSVDGLVAANASGFETVEFDVFLVRQDKDNEVGPNGRVFVTHFTDYAGFTDYRGPQVTPGQGLAGAQGYLMTTPAADLATVPKLKLRDRNDVVTNATLTPLRDFIEQAAKKQMLVVLDIKFAKPLGQTRLKNDGSGYESVKIGLDGVYPSPVLTRKRQCRDEDRLPPPMSPEDQTLQTILAINTELKGNPKGTTRDGDLRGLVIIKFPQSAIPCPTIVKWWLGGDFDELLFAPGPDTKPPGGPPPNEPVSVYTVDYIEEWMRVGPRSVSFWDTSIPSTWHWQGKPFSPVGSAVIYKDLMDYLYKVTGRRSAIWNIDPSGPGGRHGNFGMAWEHNPNTDDDSRGDQQANLVFSGASHALVTTDRPDIYLTLRNAIKAAHPQER